MKMLPSASLILYAMVFFGHLEVCHSSGKLIIQLLKFKNDRHLLKDRSCCDDWRSCSDPCDNYFKICVKEMFQNINCNMGNLKTTVLGNDDMSFPGIGGNLGNRHKNPLVFNFAKWRGATLNIEVWDHDLRGGDDFVGTVNLQITDDAKSHLETSLKQYKRVRSVSSGNRYIEMNITIHCDNNYLVPDCSRVCVAHDDDVLGHYTCDYARGRIVCNRYYYGDKCTKYCKARDDSGGHYTCDKFGGKKCTTDWFGADCATFCKARNDVTGHYTCDQKTGTKLCLAGWFGSQCMTYCVPTDDTSGYYLCDLKTGAKVCLRNWFAANCTVYCMPQGDVMLGHYSCDRNGSRLCLPGWYGTRCNSKLVSSSSEVFETSKFSMDLIDVSKSTEILNKSVYSTAIAHTSMIQRHTSTTTVIDKVTVTSNMTQYTIYATTLSKTSKTSFFVDRVSPTQSHSSLNEVTPSKSLFSSYTNGVEPRNPGKLGKRNNTAETSNLMSSALAKYRKQTTNMSEVKETYVLTTKSRVLQQTYSRNNDLSHYIQTVKTFLATVNSATSFYGNNSILFPSKNGSKIITPPFMSSTNVYQSKSASRNVTRDTMSTTVVEKSHEASYDTRSNELCVSPTPTSNSAGVSFPTSLEERTARFLLYLLSDNNNITEFESSLRDDLKNKLEGHNRWGYEISFDIKVVNRCFDSFVTIGEFRTFSTTGYFRQNMKSKLMSIFNTTEVFEYDADVGNQTDLYVCDHDKTRTFTGHQMRVLLIMAALFCFVTLIVGIMAFMKIKKRKQLFTKVHPEGSSDQIRTKKNNFVSGIPKSVSNQELLYLEDL